MIFDTDVGDELMLWFILIFKLDLVEAKHITTRRIYTTLWDYDTMSYVDEHTGYEVIFV